MVTAIPVLITEVVFCVLASVFGEWYAVRLRKDPDRGGILGLIVGALVVGVISLLPH